MVDVYWLEQTESDVPAENCWLSAGERLRLGRMHVPKRRTEWRLGRWTAKRAVAAYLNAHGDHELATIEICPAPSGAPELVLAGERAAVTISLSHRAGAAVCAVAPPGVVLGCDLEAIEPHSGAFVADYFTAQEQVLVARMSTEDQPQFLALLWSAKESALKALRVGLRVDTRSVVAHLAGLGEERASRLRDQVLAVRSTRLKAWCPLQVECFDGRRFHGWWQRKGGLVKTLVAAPPPGPPIRLNIAC